MKKLVLLALVIIMFVGCRTTNHNDFFLGMDYSARKDVSSNSVGLGFQGRPMFSEKIGLAYQVGLGFPVMLDYKANGLSIQRSDLPGAVGLTGFVGPSFKVADFNDKIAFFLTPGLNFGMNVFTHDTEVDMGYKTETLTQSLRATTLGVGIDFSSDFYLGKSFMMRLGVTMGLDFFANDTIKFGSIDESYNNGIAQFRVYPKLGIGWRKTREKSSRSTQKSS